MMHLSFIIEWDYTKKGEGGKKNDMEGKTNHSKILPINKESISRERPGFVPPSSSSSLSASGSFSVNTELYTAHSSVQPIILRRNENFRALMSTWRKNGKRLQVNL